MPNQSPDREGKSTLVSRNITVLGRRTSVRLEPEMWHALRDIARREQCRIHDICSLIQVRKKSNTSLTAAIRVFLMLYYRAATTDDGHRQAGHGDFDNMLRRARMTDDMLKQTKHPQSGINGVKRPDVYMTSSTSAGGAAMPMRPGMQ